ncbi:hypothetical protein E2320_013359 [Naja naja]|nr:hypothetical protein E2320_013359 [Naja naja]
MGSGGHQPYTVCVPEEGDRVALSSCGSPTSFQANHNPNETLENELWPNALFPPMPKRAPRRRELTSPFSSGGRCCFLDGTPCDVAVTILVLELAKPKKGANFPLWTLPHGGSSNEPCRTSFDVSELLLML